MQKDISLLRTSMYLPLPLPYVPYVCLLLSFSSPTAAGRRGGRDRTCSAFLFLARVPGGPGRRWYAYTATACSVAICSASPSGYLDYGERFPACGLTTCRACALLSTVPLLCLRMFLSPAAMVPTWLLLQCSISTGGPGSSCLAEEVCRKACSLCSSILATPFGQARDCLGCTTASCLRLRLLYYLPPLFLLGTLHRLLPLSLQLQVACPCLC